MLRRNVDGKIALARTASGEYQRFVKIQNQCDGRAIWGLARHSRCKGCLRQGCMFRSRETGNKRRTQMLFITGSRLSATNARSFGMRQLLRRCRGDCRVSEARMKGDRQLWGVTLMTLLTFGHLVLLNLFCGIIELFFSIKKGHKISKTTQPGKVQKKLCRLETTSMIMISAENSCA